MVRVRFAPSPTGNLHIGGGRTALFNWLFSQSQQGKFILRIEDTDRERSKQEFVDEILLSLKWLGFNWDELYYQSKRFDRYQLHADKLLKAGLAYIERSEAGKEATIYKVPQQKILVKDLIRGQIEFDSSSIKDQVLIKSDGTPTYNFACVVDDAEMNITHIIRGDDHISNTPKQVLLYEALKFELPQFAHLPLIMGVDGGRLSKRTGATAISDYRKMGYLPEALLNYLLLLSWAPGENRELINIQEAVKLFDIKNVNKTSATFDLKKLDWINNQYLKGADPEKLADELIPLLAAKNYIHQDSFDRGYLLVLVKLFQARLPRLNDFVEWADFFFLDEPVIDPAAKEKYLTGDLSLEFSLFAQRLDKLASFEIVNIEDSFRQLVAELGIEAKKLIHPIRVALTGKTIGPGLFEVIYYLGKERSCRRLLRWVK
ncbi:MAG: glutamate--tRNA ligase [Candidatus Omnitrophica bacterium]|nr:glutamate--tRNA ligase [Candidatus Omnitrophota bacterium]MBU4303061.1 glutamate--tRNA ligase [Candidatus Omnitrophota bacterium]MBU4468159.1 glutamate--tRNA ligase [Candidatus Omnitrophota bacterium]MCG2707354.1 glutamate--tRNA ligase [Candidatus Omnitrophota bacterium]